jgi:hypothetical protein
MINYTDSEGDKLKEGFYRDPNSSGLLYFTGEYNSYNLPKFERENNMAFGNDTLDAHSVRKLFKVGKEEVKNKLENLKEKASWLEEKLKE